MLRLSGAFVFSVLELLRSLLAVAVHTTDGWPEQDAAAGCI